MLMENAVDALKMAFAVFIFGIGTHVLRYGEVVRHEVPHPDGVEVGACAAVVEVIGAERVRHLVAQHSGVDFERSYHRAVTVGFVEEHDILAHFLSLYRAFLGVELRAVGPQQVAAADGRAVAHDDAEVVDHAVAVGIDKGVGGNDGVEVVGEFLDEFLLSQ